MPPSRRWDRVVDNPGSPFAKWFPGGELSLCYNAVDRHVDEGYGEQTALIWDSPITGRYSNAGSEICPLFSVANSQQEF